MIDPRAETSDEVRLRGVDRIHKLRRAIANLEDADAPSLTEDELGEMHERMFGCTPTCDSILQLFVARRSEVYHNRDCTPDFPTVFSQRLPLIARLNHEGRYAAQPYFEKRSTMRHSLAFVHRNTRLEVDVATPSWLM